MFYLLIRGMTSLGYKDEFFMVSALVRTVTRRIRSMISLMFSYQIVMTLPNCYTI